MGTCGAQVARRKNDCIVPIKQRASMNFAYRNGTKSIKSLEARAVELKGSLQQPNIERKLAA